MKRKKTATTIACNWQICVVRNCGCGQCALRHSPMPLLSFNRQIDLSLTLVRFMQMKNFNAIGDFNACTMYTFSFEASRLRGHTYWIMMPTIHNCNLFPLPPNSTKLYYMATPSRWPNRRRCLDVPFLGKKIIPFSLNS